MSSGKFNVGDVVKLKSGGPRMTIMRDEGDGFYFCQWFDGKGNIGQAMFPGDALTEAPDEGVFIA